ncbi:MAG: hypothetical protein ABIE14_05305 [Patescibacteria group bacterium]
MSEIIFTRTAFPIAPGGQIYEWSEVETKFEIPADGIFAVKITAAAKNAEQNNSTDDDDLRVNLDGFDFGKYEIHDEKVSWKGFGTAASFDGASLKGGTKTVYFFANLTAGEHKLEFTVDGKPELKKIEVLQLDQTFGLRDLQPTEKTETDKKGVPWLSFVFLGLPAKTLTLGVKTKSAKAKGGTDGDNLKVVVNGKILPNKKAPTSDKYKNFYFSGDLNEFDVLSLGEQELNSSLAFENSIELWYDESPKISDLKLQFFDWEEFFESVNSEGVLEICRSFANFVHTVFISTRQKYSADFLKHSLKDKPENLIFQTDDPIMKKIKSDPTYEKIIGKFKEKISSEILDGEVLPSDFDGGINFDSPDLNTAIHGVKKIEYKAIEKSSGNFEVDFTIFDVYNFEMQKHSLFTPKKRAIDAIAKCQELNIISNFEIRIILKENIRI